MHHVYVPYVHGERAAVVLENDLNKMGLSRLPGLQWECSVLAQYMLLTCMLCSMQGRRCAYIEIWA